MNSWSCFASLLFLTYQMKFPGWLKLISLCRENHNSVLKLQRIFSDCNVSNVWTLFWLLVASHCCCQNSRKFSCLKFTFIWSSSSCNAVSLPDWKKIVKFNQRSHASRCAGFAVDVESCANRVLPREREDALAHHTWRAHRHEHVWACLPIVIVSHSLQKELYVTNKQFEKPWRKAHTRLIKYDSVHTRSRCLLVCTQSFLLIPDSRSKTEWNVPAFESILAFSKRTCC